MKRFLTYLVLMLSFAMVTHAQVIDARLTELVPRPAKQTKRSASVAVTVPDDVDLQEVKKEMLIHLNDDGTLKSLSVLARLKKKAEDPTAELEKLGITVVLRVGRILILDVPAEKLYELENVKAIERASADGVCRLTNDIARSETHVNVLNGEDPDLFTSSGIPAASTEYPYYTGKGVVAGVVDRGIDFNHSAFRDSEGSTRLKMALVQKGEGVLSYQPEDIPSLTTGDEYESHGTHTSVTVAGTPITVSCLDANGAPIDLDLRGMAPDADLMLADFPNLYNSHILQAVSQFMSYAKEHNQPIVVNLSIGNIGGFYDGSEEVCEALTELTGGGTDSGRVIVCSAGNDGYDRVSILHTITQAEGPQLTTGIYTSLKRNLTIGGNTVKVSMYEDPYFFFYLRDKGSFEVEFKAVNMETGKVYNLATSETYDEETERPFYRVKAGGDQLYTPPTALKQDNGKNYYQWYKTGDFYFTEPDLYLLVSIKGAAVGSELVMIENNYDANFSSLRLGYTMSSNDLSISCMAVTNGMISAGAYSTRCTYYTYPSGSERKDTWVGEVGRSCLYSSYGTDDNGYDRPDVIAPGALFFSAFNSYDKTTVNGGALDGEYAYQVVGNTTLHGRDNYYGAKQGTSMSAPCVSGIVALWLQANPKLSVNDVRRIIRLTADQDEFTTDLDKIPAHDFRQVGCGKINALKGLKLITSEADNTITLSDAADNTDLLTEYEGKTVSVTLAGRTLYRDGSWNTLCLPFDVNIAESPLDGYNVKVMTLDPATTSFEDGTLTLNFVEPANHKLLAGVPYIIKWDHLPNYNNYYDISNPTFRFVTISSTEPGSVGNETVSLVGTYAPVSIAASGDASKLYLAADNKLYYPGGAMNINCQRAYFQLGEGLTATEASNANIRQVVLNLPYDDEDEEDVEVTVIRALDSDPATLSRLTDEWYTLSGMRLTGRPTQRGLYLQRGRKVYVE